MNAIMLTSGIGRPSDCRPRAATAASVPAKRDVATGDGSIGAANAKPDIRRDSGANYREWETAGSGVETALFVSVQAVMLACIVLVAAQLFAAV